MSQLTNIHPALRDAFLEWSRRQQHSYKMPSPEIEADHCCMMVSDRWPHAWITHQRTMTHVAKLYGVLHVDLINFCHTNGRYSEHWYRLHRIVPLIRTAHG